MHEPARQAPQPSADQTRRFVHTVTQAEHGQRIDAALALMLDGYSRVFLRKVVQDGGARVDGVRVKPSFRLQTGQQIEVDLPPPPDDGPRPEAIPLNFLYEDEHLVAVDKPPGMVVHPAKGNWSGTLASALAHHFAQLSDVGGPTRPGIIHRLDRDTSGVILVAKTNRIHLAMSEMFEQRRVQKEYFAIALGNLELDSDIIRMPIGPHPYQRDKMAIRRDHPQSREAETQYQVDERFDGITTVRVFPRTGRTHQIRVHLDHIGAPVLCDRLYAGHSQITRGELFRRIARRQPPESQDDQVVLDRHALHARRLTFVHPVTQRELTIESPLPADMQCVLDILRARDAAGPKRT
ncbi:MAG: RluA family pseudouridine synthase [Planctomycetota bacterium]|nr:MAG: RluA family pseudouridine synthase [Planctomycetota bacterium]